MLQCSKNYETTCVRCAFFLPFKKKITEQRFERLNTLKKRDQPFEVRFRRTEFPKPMCASLLASTQATCGWVGVCLWLFLQWNSVSFVSTKIKEENVCVTLIVADWRKCRTPWRHWDRELMGAGRKGAW